MKIGISTYSLFQELKKGSMSVLDVIDWIADLGSSYIEIVPLGFELLNNPRLLDDVINKIDERKLDVSNYAVGANFSLNEEDNMWEEVEEAKSQVDIAISLGSKQMRLDAGWLDPGKATVLEFQKRLPAIAKAIRKVVDYARTKNILLTVENHGFFIQHSDRILQLLSEVNDVNYKTTIDVGNFMCVDEDPYVAVKKLIPYAAMVHIKDFYLRKFDPGAGWFQTSGGRSLRGAIIGNGDVNLLEILQFIKNYGYDEHLSVEFEGMENAKLGTKIGYQNLQRIMEVSL